MRASNFKLTKTNFVFAFIIMLIGCCIFFTQCSQSNQEIHTNASPQLAVSVKLKGSTKARLSEYGFFKDLKNQIPADDVIPYELNSPLFSDYAHKARFVKLPQGTAAGYKPRDVFDFPKGTIIIKTFYYPHDFRNADKGHFNIETRLLIHEENGWAAYSYIWNEEQTDAFYEVAGGRKDITWTHYDGSKKELSYAIPNVNQCKGCHIYNGKMVPIGPTARQLNGDFTYHDGTRENQLIYWSKKGILAHLPDLSQVDKAANPDDPHASLEAKARAYLDINCAHCHREGGPAVTSGLLTDFYQTNTTKLGFYKNPVAAGRGSGNLKYDIVPGKPDESILVFRMESTDPGIMMPELARKMKHEEGVQLIRQWIASLKESDYKMAMKQ
jgi:uncharacterized repeat protein (TIGR03806 family)